MTIAALMDTPLLRDRDETENNGIGFYGVPTPRTGDGVWNGSSLYVNKVGWERIADFTLPGTMGRQVLANGSGVALPSVSDPSVWDQANSFTVDIYGTSTLSSASEADVGKGQNMCLLGDEVIGFTTATQVGGQPNRWTLSGLLRGQRTTGDKVSTHILNERFVLLNEAVKFVPISVNDKDQALDYRMVTSGQSLRRCRHRLIYLERQNTHASAREWSDVADREFLRVAYNVGPRVTSRAGHEARCRRSTCRRGRSLSTGNLRRIHADKGPAATKEQASHSVGWVRVYIEGSPGNLVPNRDGSTSSVGGGSGLRGIMESVQTLVGDFFFEVTIGATGNWLFKTGLAQAPLRFMRARLLTPPSI